MKTLKDLKLNGQTVLLRLDVNVPLDDVGNITNDYKLREGLPTINYLLEKNCKIVILSSLGRPEGKVVESLRLNKIAARFSELLKQPVHALDKVLGQKDTISVIKDRVIVLENLRFCPEEEQNDDAFARELASYGEVYVNDAFANSHREHASMVGIPQYLPSAAGLLVDKEVSELSKVLQNPARPLCAILGGVKLETKVKLVQKMAELADTVLIGGKLANTFLKAQGVNLAGAEFEGALVMTAKMIIEKTADAKIILPGDVRGTNQKGEFLKTVSEISADDKVLDIGGQTLSSFKEIINRAKTIVWNGAMGFFEDPRFSRGTHDLVKILADAKAYKVVGGGETVEVIEKLGLKDKFNHVSTGGGAMLEYLEKGTLAALAVLN
jgi:phosphoglycerate kinase